MINLLIRTCYRPQQFKACYASIDYPCNTIVVYDDPRAAAYVDGDTVIEIKTHGTGNFFYNEYCNLLLQHFTSGHGLFLDDDDLCIPGALSQLGSIVKPGVSYVVPFLRAGSMKPWPSLFRNKTIQAGTIGLPCMVLWHEHKKYINFDATETADFKAIRQLNKRVNLEWVNLPIVSSQRRGMGATE